MALDRRRLLRVSKATQADIQLWSEGVALERDSGQTVQALLERAAVDRWQLARLQLRQGKVALRATPPRYRTSISRFYYAMYHAARAAVFLETRGDDHQEHRKLPSQIPAALPSAPAGSWQNRLKDAREVRNSADYDPLPVDARYWRTRALRLESEAEELVQVTRVFLRSKGCTI